MELFPSLIQGSRVQLHPLAHTQFASLHSVQRLSQTKNVSDKYSLPGTSPSLIPRLGMRLDKPVPCFLWLHQCQLYMFIGCSHSLVYTEDIITLSSLHPGIVAA